MQLVVHQMSPQSHSKVKFTKEPYHGFFGFPSWAGMCMMCTVRGGWPCRWLSVSQRPGEPRVKPLSDTEKSKKLEGKEEEEEEEDEKRRKKRRRRRGGR